MCHAFALVQKRSSKNSMTALCSVLYLVVLLYLTLCNFMDYSLPGSSVRGDSPGKNTRLGCHALLQGIFPTQRLNSGFPHCRQILYRLSHQGSPRIQEWVAYPFCRESSQPRNRTGVSYIAGRNYKTPRGEHRQNTLRHTSQQDPL